MEERRFLLAVSLSVLVFMAYSFWFAPKPPTPTPSPRPTLAPVTTPPPPAPTSAEPPVPAKAVAKLTDSRERRVEVLGRDVNVAFTNRGARLVSWRLLHFKDQHGRPEEMVLSLAGVPYPLDLDTGDEALDERLRGALFMPSREGLELGDREEDLRFEFAEGDLIASKTFHFAPHGYLVAIKASLERAGKAIPVKVLWGPGVGNPTAAEMEVQGYQPAHGVVLTANGVDRLMPEKAGPLHVFGEVGWVGLEVRYFAAIFIPASSEAKGELRTLELPAKEGEKPRMVPVVAVPLSAAETTTLLYVGPKDYNSLAGLGHGLEKVVPVGEWIGPIVVPFMRLLSWVNSRVSSYGWSILVLTVLINVVMAPLRHYSISNGLRMAKLSPEMKVIQERYRKVPALDPRRQEMQKEIAALYERHGMNMGAQMAIGCLPILLTMPFLIAIYRVLQVSIELRGAPFLWIPDLSQKDPMFLTPALMGISMFIMQRITPSAMDPAQQRMMMIMPVFLVVMFSAAPAGLNLYWLASNLCSIVQQSVTLRVFHQQSAAGPRKGKKSP